MIRFEARLVLAADDLADKRLDGRQQLDFVGADQRHRLTRGAGTAGTADAVHVVLGDDRQVEVDHPRQFADVQATGGHVGGGQHTHLAGLESLQRAQARRLRLVTVDRVGSDALGQQQLLQLVDALAGLGEHQQLVPATLAVQVQQQLALALLVHRHQPLLDPLGRGVARADLDGQRVAQQFLGHQADGVGEGGGEQQGLALARQRTEQLVQLLGEAQVEHAVGLVQHQRLQLVEAHRVLPVQVEQATGGGHQQVDALAQLHHLRVDADPAVHRVGAQWQVLRVLLHRLRHLLGQLAGRHQHQRAHRVGRHLRAFHGQLLQQRQGEAGGLAGTGLRRSEHITALEHGGNGLLLHRRGLAVIECLKSAQDGIDQAKVGEGHGGATGSGKLPV